MRSLLRVCLMVAVSLLLSVAFTSQQRAMAQAEDDVVINEFTVNPNNGKEYVELLVTNPSGVNMQGWTLSDVGTRAGATAGTEGDVTLPAAAYLANVPAGTHVVIVFTTPATNAQVLAEDTSTTDGNKKLVLIAGTTTGVITAGTIDAALSENFQLYAGTRAVGTLIDQVLTGTNTSYIAGASWGDNNGATTSDNITPGSSPVSPVARFVPTSDTQAGFQDNDTNARWVVDNNSYGTPGFRNAGVRSEVGVSNGFAPRPKIADFDKDGKTDVSVWRSDEGNWYILQSGTANALRVQLDWGRASLGDEAVPGDYDGDGKTDIAVYRDSEQNWYIIQSSTNSPRIVNWGGDPVQADYDGDGKTDIAVWRPNEGNWYIINSSTNTAIVRNWGQNGDSPTPGDYDNDGRADLAVFRSGNWFILRSSGGTSVQQWGNADDSLVPADYDGDGITDLAVFRYSEGNWYIRRSGGGVTIRNWGGVVNTGGNAFAFDQLVPGDYDGDGQVDIAIYRDSEGNWYIIRSSDGGVTLLNLSGNTPVPTAYLPGYAVGDIIFTTKPAAAARN